MKSNNSGLALRSASAIVEGAQDYIELFKQCNGNDAAQKAHLRKEYMRYAKVLHPDLYTDPEEIKIAEESFRKMQEFLAEAEQAIKEGTYGKAKPKIIFETKSSTHILNKRIATGDISDIYKAETTTGTLSYSTIVKVTRDPNDNDLSINEQNVLKKLQKAKDLDTLKPFVTRLADCFNYTDTVGEHNVNVIENPADGFIDIETLRNKYFPDGLPAKHAAWIWRRVLLGLELAHETGIVHGALVPSNILIQPELHGVVVSDWSYAVDVTKSSHRVTAIVNAKKDWYPPEVLAKEQPYSGTDTYMAAQSMIWLMGGDPISKKFPDNVPIEIQRYFKGCTVNSKIGRPDDAIELLKEFDELLKSIGKPYHPRKFVPLTI